MISNRIHFNCSYAFHLLKYVFCNFQKGVNWCAPYKDWKLFYGNDPIKLLKSFNVNVTDKIRVSILGQEAAMWSETVCVFENFVAFHQK